MKYLEGFDCRSQVHGDGQKPYPVGASVTIAKGDALSLTSGYLALGTALDATFVGIAANDADNGSGSNGDIDCAVIPPLPEYKFRVQVEADQLVTLAAVGTIIDIQTEDGVDISDTTVTANGFFVDEIDVSADSVAANTYGHVTGHFVAIT